MSLVEDEKDAMFLAQGCQEIEASLILLCILQLRICEHHILESVLGYVARLIHQLKLCFLGGTIHLLILPGIKTCCRLTVGIIIG